MSGAHRQGYTRGEWIAADLWGGLSDSCVKALRFTRRHPICVFWTFGTCQEFCVLGPLG
jgi:hypothetical protein